MHQVFPDGTSSSQETEGQCPVRTILVRGDQGENELLSLRDLSVLEPGARVFREMSTTIASLHPSFPKDCWYLPGMNRHWSNNLDK